jgi:hypothetical protein
MSDEDARGQNVDTSGDEEFARRLQLEEEEAAISLRQSREREPTDVERTANRARAEELAQQCAADAEFARRLQEDDRREERSARRRGKYKCSFCAVASCWRIIFLTRMAPFGPAPVHQPRVSYQAEGQLRHQPCRLRFGSVQRWVIESHRFPGGGLDSTHGTPRVGCPTPTPSNVGPPRAP